MKILFLCGENAIRSQMADGFFRELGKGKGTASSAGVTRGRVHPLAIRVMKEVGIDLTGQSSKTVADLGALTFDLIVALCDPAREYCFRPGAPEGVLGTEPGPKSPLFVGLPIFLHWDIPEPAEKERGDDAALESFRHTRDRVRSSVEALVNQGYLDALADQRRAQERILDGLEEGILVHDDARRIYVFNRAAERITGLERKAVLGKDCHRVFQPDGLCGSQCSFCTPPAEPPEWAEYAIRFTTPDGESKRLNIRARQKEIGPGSAKGVIAVIRDITEVSELRWRSRRKHRFHGIVGISRAMQGVYEAIREAGPSDYPVLITGESGTGKELVAGAVHAESRRKKAPFVPVNCGALPENILESELFGHVRGAFTGAIRNKKGRFELADGGTLFFDEIGELSPAFQVKLLRVLQEGRFERVGGEDTITANVRVICATNRDLRAMVEEGAFREDLFYRLCVVPIHLPPLRDRREDIPLLVDAILEDVRRESGKEILNVSDAAMDSLLAHAWPGYIRELINAIQFASVRSREETIHAGHLPPEVQRAAEGADAEREKAEMSPPVKRRGRRRKLDRNAVERALREAGGNKVKAAKRLGVGRATLYRFLKENPVSK
ncbi:MAG: sigma 54-interacting transcriptional regulator [Planctomycetota bacterium]